MKYCINLLLIVSCLCVFSSQTSAQHAVSLDATFGVNGKVRTMIDPEGQIYSHLLSVRQDDGKIVAASSFAGYPVVVRYLPDGDLDPTWGQNGIVRAIDTIPALSVYKLELLDNGQIVIMGAKWGAGSTGEARNFIIKYNSDGSLDQTFGVNGTVNYYLPSGSIFTPSSGFIYNGKIYLVGMVPMELEYGIIAFDLNTGALDTTFGNNGFLQSDLGTDVSNGISWITPYVTEDNKIRTFIGGRIYQLLPDFQVDVNGGFGTNGFIELPCGLGIRSKIGTGAHGTEGLAQVVGARLTRIEGGDFFLTGINFHCPLDLGYKKGLVRKYHYNGEIDSSFADNGQFEVDFRGDTSERNFISSVRVLSNGYMLVSGGVYINSNNSDVVSQKFAMALFDENGNPVNSFSSLGNIYIEDYFHTDDHLDWVSNTYIQEEDGKVVLIGFTPHYDIYEVMPVYTWDPRGNVSINLSRYIIKGIAGNVGVQDEHKEYFTYYPSPTNSTLKIKSSKQVNIVSVYNYLGELVVTKESNKTIDEINVEHLSSGVYTVRLTTKSGKMHNGRFVKQ